MTQLHARLAGIAGSKLAPETLPTFVNRQEEDGLMSEKRIRVNNG